MGKDDSGKSLWHKPVKYPPYNAAHHGGHDEHKIERCYMHQRVAQGRDKKAFVGIVLRR